MKLNQKIIKAINEGIRKSLLSFDETEFEFTKSDYINQKVAKSIDDYQYDQMGVVDLGLPSGTLWANINLGATCGSTPESWYGKYYAWGEIKPKKSYTYRTYHTYQSDELPKKLPLDHDVAYQKTKGSMCIPTKKQIEELMQLPNTWVTDYNGISGLNGRLFTGKNRNELFIPAAGLRYDSDPYNYNNGYGIRGFFWASNSFKSRYAYSVRFVEDDIDIRYDPPEIGFAIRPVQRQ